MMEFDARNAQYRALVEREIKRCLQERKMPEKLFSAMSYSVDAGGKRLRPCMLLAAAEMTGGSMAGALVLAAGIEMIHTYSLIHDDLPCMDDDDYRRGRPSNHRVYGEGMATLAGDGLLSLAFESMIGAAAEQLAASPGYLRALGAIAEGAGVAGMVAGQAADLEAEINGISGFDGLIYIHAHKTAAMIRAAMLAGVQLGENVSATQFDAAMSYAEHFGLLFQITDDILDVEGSFEELGKSIGKDNAHEKLTFVTLLGMDEAKCRAKAEAEAAIGAASVFGNAGGYFITLAERTVSRKK